MAERQQGGFELRVLGPVEVSRNGTPVAIGGPRQRALLGLLAMRPGRVVSVDHVVDELWSGEPPDGADVTVRTYVSRLRAALGDAVRIEASAGGYVLRVEPASIDAGRLEKLVGDAEAAMRDRNPRRAAGLLRSALGLWRGRPFGELGGEGDFRIEADRLEEVRLRALELRIEADLGLGAAADLVDELDALTATHPYREGFWRQLMLALYRSERQADALAAYHRARRGLDEQLGIEPGVALQELEAAILRHDVPVPEVPGQHDSLPAPITSFIGRAGELADVAEFVREHRLVTLTGVGGVGKTRLGIEVARRLADEVPGGAWFVDLAPLADSTMVAPHVGGALGVREQPGIDPAERLVGQLGDRAMVLVLDNCEHVREGVADLVTRLLGSCPELRVLATSREVLGVTGEAEYAVPPLGLPTGGGSPSELRDADAVRLFLARARDARPDLPDDDETIETIARICSDLDSLPLAIELAAARARALSPAEIAGRLRDRFQFLVSWRRLMSARHRTLREAMDWSYGLLDEDEQRVLRELSVFAGGFTLAAVAAVCTDGDEALALRRLERLAEASLVIVYEVAAATRFRFLETVRQYGAEQLEAAGMTDELRDRHAGHFALMAEAAWQPLRVGGVGSEWLTRIDRDRDNFRAALAWSLDRSNHDQALRISESLWWYWWMRGGLREGHSWLARSLEGASGSPPRTRARSLMGLAGLAWAMGEVAAAVPSAEEAARLFDELGEHHGAGSARNTLGLLANARGDIPLARAYFEGAIEQFLAAEMEPGFKRSNLGVAIDNLGSAAHDLGDDEEARRRYEEARAINAELGDEAGVAMNDLHLAILDVEARRWTDARRRLVDSIGLYRRVSFLLYTADCLECAAVVANGLGAPREAAFALGAADHVRRQVGNAPAPVMVRLREREEAAARAALGAANYDAARAEGLAAPIDTAIERALGFLADPSEASGR